MRLLRRSLLLVSLAVLLTVSGAFATWVFSGGGIDGVTGWLTPSFGDFVCPTAVYITRAGVGATEDATGRVTGYQNALLHTATTLGGAADAFVTYRVELLNNAGKDMAYAGITVPEGGHSNPAIAYHVG
ncbi:MAG: hypothetical protein J6V07_03930, partial [Clostridia bacterium]|nr:hypothetical protein [Clostridia bacterium]